MSAGSGATPAVRIDVEFLYEERVYVDRGGPYAYLVTIPCRLPVVDELPEIASFTLADGRTATYRGYEGRAFLSVLDFRSLGLGPDAVPAAARDGLRLYMTDLGLRCANVIDEEIAEHMNAPLPRRMAPLRWGDDVRLAAEHLARIGEHVERYRAAAVGQGVVFEGQLHVAAPFPRWHVWREDGISLEHRSGSQFVTSSFPADEHDKALAFAALRSPAGTVIATRGAVSTFDGRYREESLLNSIGREFCRMLVTDSERQIDGVVADMPSDLVRSWTLVREADALRQLTDTDHARDCIVAGMAIEEAVRKGSIRLDGRIVRRLQSLKMKAFRQRAFVEGLVPNAGASGRARVA